MLQLRVTCSHCSPSVAGQDLYERPIFVQSMNSVYVTVIQGLVWPIHRQTLLHMQVVV